MDPSWTPLSEKTLLSSPVVSSRRTTLPIQPRRARAHLLSPALARLVQHHPDHGGRQDRLRAPAARGYRPRDARSARRDLRPDGPGFQRRGPARAGGGDGLRPAARRALRAAGLEPSRIGRSSTTAATRLSWAPSRRVRRRKLDAGELIDVVELPISELAKDPAERAHSRADAQRVPLPDAAGRARRRASRRASSAPSSALKRRSSTSLKRAS